MRLTTLVAMTTASLSLVASAAAAQTGAAVSRDSLTITRRDTRPVQQGAANRFTGSVRIEALFDTTAQSRVSGGSVSFEPGARTAWHTHPAGQTLIVTAGGGRVQRWGGPIADIRVGDVVSIPAGVKHWHGASPTTAMTHTAIQETLDGRNVDWMEQVTEQQYRTTSSSRAPGGVSSMSNDSTSASPAASASPYADISPALAAYTDNVLYGDVWKRPGLSPRDRSLITVAALVAMYRQNELPAHLKLATANGVTRDELSELITHLAFYAGWPTANTAVEITRKFFDGAKR